MELQWGQIVTQMIGFLLAVWLIKKYAWEGLLGFIEKRREAIASSFAEIERLKTEAEQTKARFEKEIERIEEIRRAKIQEAAREGEKLAGEIKEEARRQAIAMREKTQQDIAIELDKANALLRDRIVDTVITSTEKILREKLDPDRHKKLISDFLDEVKVG